MGPMMAPIDMLEDLELTAADVDKARALGPCGNPDCKNLAGASEFELRSQRCSRCRVLSFCCKACQAQAWPQHRNAGACRTVAHLA